MSNEIDVMQLAADVMERRGYAVNRRDACIEHPDSGLVVRPTLVESYPSPLLFRTVSVVTTSHPRLIPEGVFEYQHSVGKTLVEAFCTGFDQWLQLDFVVLVDALRDPPQYCNAMEIALPRTGGPSHRRRAVLGPIGYAVEHAERTPSEHPFCTCCFLTKTFEEFRPLLETDGFYGIRMYAARDYGGAAKADCRVNGEDWDAGKRALLDYVETWPRAGVEIRKQYVVLQSLDVPR